LFWKNPARTIVLEMGLSSKNRFFEGGEKVMAKAKKAAAKKPAAKGKGKK